MNTSKDKRNSIKQKKNNLKQALFEVEKETENIKKGLSTNNGVLPLSVYVSSFLLFNRVGRSLVINYTQCMILFALLHLKLDNERGVRLRAVSDLIYGYRSTVKVHTYENANALVDLGYVSKRGSLYCVSDVCYVRLIGLLS